MKTKGFTVIELTITMTIMAILAMAAFPSFRDSIKQNRVKAEVVELKADIMWAKSEATKLHKDVTLVFNATGWDVVNKESHEIYRKHGMPKEVELEFPEDLTIAPEITVSGFKGYLSGPAYVTFNSDKYAGTVVIWPLGFVEECSNNLKDYTKC